VVRGSGGQTDDVVEELIDANERADSLLASGILEGISVALLALVLPYLYRVVKYRRDQLPRALRTLSIAAPLALGAIAIAFTVQQINSVEAVTAQLPLAPPDASDLLREEQRKSSAALIAILGTLAALSLAAVMILLSQGARRAGVLSNFIGIIGIIVGGAFVIGPLIGSFLGPVPVVLWFFTGAIAALAVGRWPGGRPPAWETGEEEPWPSPQELRAQRDAEAMERRERKEAEEAEAEPAGEPAAARAVEEPGTPAHPRSKKRKKKKRR
jgi:hypothetical protein